MTEKPKRRIIKPATTKNRPINSARDAAQPRRLKVPSAAKTGQSRQRREFHLPLPDNKVGRLLGRRVHLVPSYLREAWQEVRLVAWPNRRDTLRLSLAVFIFAVIFGGLIWVVDYGLDRLFREVLLDLR
jgi:preprotein translocase SecE subunit